MQEYSNLSNENYEKGHTKLIHKLMQKYSNLSNQNYEKRTYTIRVHVEKSLTGTSWSEH